MDHARLAAELSAADDEARALLLARYSKLVDARLARALKALYDAAESSDPPRAAGAAAALACLAGATDDPETRGLARWTAGMAALDAGRLEQAIADLAAARAEFMALRQPLQAAAVDVSSLIALAIVGRYDEALACGQTARDVFLAHADILAAGKIEQNLGNIHWRRGAFPEAERCYRAARERFLAAGDQKELARVHNNLANALSVQHLFRDAAATYEQALAYAQAAGLDVTQAEIECNVGCCALDQGHYDRALDYLERARRRYVALGMPRMAAGVDLELADTYLELNLAREAAAIYDRIAATFADAGMRAEQARAAANHGRACLLLGRVEAARRHLAHARALYVAEGNPVGAAIVTLIEAQISYQAGDYAAAADGAAQAAVPLEAARLAGSLLVARWLYGESLRALGRLDQAAQVLETALADAERQVVPQIVQRCHTSLGLIARERGDPERAEAAFRRAVALIEQLRAPLPADEFRTAFVADKLTAYAELVRLCLADAAGARVGQALGYVERARARALVDMLGGALQPRINPSDQFEVELLARLRELREELNWFYGRINRARDGATTRGAAEIAGLQAEVRERESAILEITRQIQQRSAGPRASGAAIPQPEPLDIAQLQRDLGTTTALVEYFSLDEEMLAFVVTGERVEVVRGLGQERQVARAIERLYFQIGALRNGADALDPFLEELAARTRRHLGALYDLLVRPIEPWLGSRRLVVAPHRGLYYVPFHALYDGGGYLIERREVSYAPSAAVLRHCLAQPRRAPRSAALIGFSDEHSPWVRREVLTLGALLPGAAVLLDEQATLGALRAHVPHADVLHLASHGQFRPDSPLFSSLRLADGWLTVRDVYDLELPCQLVTLSGCETGVSAIAPGDELIGLTRGFLSAGATTLLVSLWTVDDQTTAMLMRHFYARVCAGESPAAALRGAERELLAERPHPFFWSPFVLFGRW